MLYLRKDKKVEKFNFSTFYFYKSISIESPFSRARLYMASAANKSNKPMPTDLKIVVEFNRLSFNSLS